MAFLSLCCLGILPDWVEISKLKSVQSLVVNSDWADTKLLVLALCRKHFTQMTRTLVLYQLA